MSTLLCPRCDKPVDARSPDGRAYCSFCRVWVSPGHVSIRAPSATAIQSNGPNLPSADPRIADSERESRRRIRKRQRLGLDSFERPEPTLRRPEGQRAARIAQIFLGLSGAFDAGIGVAYLWMMSGDFNLTDLPTIFTIFACNLIHVVLFIAALVSFLNWLLQAHDNIRYLRRPPMRWPRAMAGAGFFIPFANLLIPYFVLQEIWRASDPETGEPDGLEPHRSENSALILAWAIVWNLLWVGFIFAFQFFKQRFEAAFAMASIFVLMLPIPATLAILIVGGIVDRQEKRWQTLIGEDVEAGGFDD
jgi:Domain of unknown function (DUF4328)